MRPYAADGNIAGLAAESVADFKAGSQPCDVRKRLDAIVRKRFGGQYADGNRNILKRLFPFGRGDDDFIIISFGVCCILRKRRSARECDRN